MTCLAGLLLLSLSTECAAKQWSLRDCIDYALANNIQLQKAKIKEYSALEDVKQSQAALLPSLNLSTSQNVSYTPWPQQGRATVADGYVQSSVLPDSCPETERFGHTFFSAAGWLPAGCVPASARFPPDGGPLPVRRSR